MNTNKEALIIIAEDVVFQQYGALATKVGGVIETSPQDIKDAVKGLDPEDHVIIVSKLVVDALTAEEYSAIIAHEQGHIALGHLDTVPTDFVGIIDNQQMELEADAYAAKIVGPAVLSGALVSVIGAIFNAPWVAITFKENTGIEMTNDHFNNILSNTAVLFQYRFDALAAM